MRLKGSTSSSSAPPARADRISLIADRRNGVRDQRYAISGLRQRGIFAALAFLASCATPVQQYALKDLRLSCDEANRTTYKALTAMGFTVSAFTPAAMGRPGEAKGVREGRTADGGAKNVTVTITCEPTGTAVDARDDGKVMGQVEFKRAFFLSFTSTQHMDERRREMEEKVAAGTAPASQQRQGLQVLVEPVRGQAAKLDFEIDMAAAGILPVRLRVMNATARAYSIAVADVQLIGRDRSRVAPMSVAQVVARVTQARDTQGQPLTAMSAAELSDRLGRALFSSSRINARGDAAGYVYFPLGDYVRARVLVTDVETEEAEGFAVEF